MKKIIAAAAIALSMAFASPVMAASMATGGPDGFYNNGLFNRYQKAISSSSRKQIDLERFDEEGTNGTLENLELTDAGESDYAFIQKDGLALETYSNVKYLGNIMYEIPHLVTLKKSKIKDIEQLDGKNNKFTVGVNKMSGAWITAQAMQKSDKDFLNVNFVNVDDALDARMMLEGNEIQAYFFVCAAGQGDSKEFSGKQWFYADVWDGSFKKFNINGQQAYEKITIKKKSGYPNNFYAFTVPTGVVGNTEFLSEEKINKRAAMRATSNVYGDIKAQKKYTFYPEDN